VRVGEDFTVALEANFSDNLLASALSSDKPASYEGVYFQNIQRALAGQLLIVMSIAHFNWSC